MRSAPPSPPLRYERRCILQDGRTGWRISQLSRPEKDEYPRTHSHRKTLRDNMKRLNTTRTAFAQPTQTKDHVEIVFSVGALNENTSSLDSVPQDGHTVRKWLETPSIGEKHGSVKRQEPAVHVVGHICFDTRDSIDGLAHGGQCGRRGSRGLRSATESSSGRQCRTQWSIDCRVRLRN